MGAAIVDRWPRADRGPRIQHVRVRSATACGIRRADRGDHRPWACALRPACR